MEETVVKFKPVRAKDKIRHELLTNGYARQKRIPAIPICIIKLIAEYVLDTDVWDESTTHSLIRINNDLIETDDIGWPYHMAFGSLNIFKPEVKEWIIQLNCLEFYINNSNIIYNRATN
eukprot:981873_1